MKTREKVKDEFLLELTREVIRQGEGFRWKELFTDGYLDGRMTQLYSIRLRKKGEDYHAAMKTYNEDMDSAIKQAQLDIIELLQKLQRSLR